MLYFNGYGQKNNIRKSRDDIIKAGYKNNADIFKVNDVLKSFNTQLLTVQEALEYIIKDSINDMTINSPEPKLSDFGISSDDIKRIGNYKNIYFANTITVAFISWIISLGTGNSSLIFIALLLYAIWGFWYFNFDKKYKNYIERIEMYNAVSKLYYTKHKELEDVIRRLKEEEQERIRQKEEEERQRQEAIKRQKVSYWEEILNDKTLSTMQRGQIFEKEMTKLFKRLGWEVKLTQASKDGGVDIIIDIDNERCLVQCKFYKGKVGVEPVRALWGIKDSYNADRVMMLAYSGVTQGGEDFAEEKNRGRAKGDWQYKICDINDIIRWYSMTESR